MKILFRIYFTVMLKRLLLFLFINFAALGFGGLFTNTAINSDWYMNLKIAPWTPPSWFFGFAWTTIMICLAIYMAFAWVLIKEKTYLLFLFVGQLLLNILWNPVFFYFQQILLGLVIITILTILLGFILFTYQKVMGSKSLLLLPYFIWLIVATSLNAYIFLMN